MNKLFYKRIKAQLSPAQGWPTCLAGAGLTDEGQVGRALVDEPLAGPRPVSPQLATARRRQVGEDAAEHGVPPVHRRDSPVHPQKVLVALPEAHPHAPHQRVACARGGTPRMVT